MTKRGEECQIKISVGDIDECAGLDIDGSAKHFWGFLGDNEFAISFLCSME